MPNTLLAQTFSTETVRNGNGNVVFELRFYNSGEFVPDNNGWLDNLWDQTPAYNATRPLESYEKAAIIRAFDYWTERLYPDSAPYQPAVVNIGYDKNLENNALARVTNERNFWNVFVGKDPQNLSIDGYLVFGTLDWKYDRNTQLFGYSDKGSSMESIAIHEIAHALGIFSLDTANIENNGVASEDYPALVQGSPGNKVFTGDNAKYVWTDGWRGTTARNNVPMARSQENAHFGIQNGLMTHQSFRNYSGFMEVELAAINDLGYNIDLRNFFGRSIYTGGNTGDMAITYKDGFFNSKGLDSHGNWLGYEDGVANTSSYGLGLHLYGSNNKVTVAEKSILANGEGAAGIRVDGFNNTVTIEKGIEVIADGDNGTGLLVAFGTNHHIINKGTIQANGTDGVAVRFDFGEPYSDRDGGEAKSYGWVYDKDANKVSLGGPLVKQFDVSGDIYADTAIYIGKGAHVETINIMKGATIVGDIKTGDGPYSTTLTFGKKADSNGVATDTYEAAQSGIIDMEVTGSVVGKFDIVAGGGYAWLSGTDINVQNVTVESGAILDIDDEGTGNMAVINGDVIVKKNGILTACRAVFDTEWIDDLYRSGTIDVPSGMASDCRSVNIKGNVTNSGFLAFFDEVTIDGKLTNKDNGGLFCINNIYFGGNSSNEEGSLFYIQDGTTSRMPNFVNSGTFIVNGTLIAEEEFTNVLGGIISGSGRVQSKIIRNFGTVSPYHSIGDLSFVCNEFVNEPTGILSIEVMPSTNPVAGTNSDLITVSALDANTGIATINGGYAGISTVTDQTGNTAATAEQFTDGAKYTFLKTDNGLTVNKELEIFDDLPLFDYFTGGYNENTYWVIFDSQSKKREYVYGNFADTNNQRSVGNYIDITSSDPVIGSDFYNVLIALDAQNAGIINRTGISNAAKHALDQMSGSIYGTHATASVMNVGIVNNTLANLLRQGQSKKVNNCNPCDIVTDCEPCEPCEPCAEACDPCEPICDAKSYKRHLWGLGYGTGGASQFDGNTYGYNQSFGGTIIGTDREYKRGIRLGGYFSYGEGRISSALLDRSESHELLAGLYFRKNMYNGYVLASAGLGNTQYDTQRTISFVNRLARNKHDAFVGTFYAERGLDFATRLGQLQPYLGIQYIGNRQERFTETGAGSLNLVAKRTETDSFRSLLGTRFQSNVRRYHGGRLNANANVAWLHEFADTSTSFTAGLAGSPIAATNFTVRGNDTQRDWVILGVGLNYEKSRVRLFGGYDTYCNNQQVLHTGNAGFVYGW